MGLGKASAAAGAGLLVVLAAGLAASAADTASGELRCNATSIPIRAAVARWTPPPGELRVMLFTAEPPAEAVRFWTEGGGRGAYPSAWGYAAAFTFTFTGPQATRAALRDFVLYVECPTVQANLGGSSFTRGAAEKLRQGFPVFEATLGPGGRVRMTARGADKLELPAPTSVTWDVRVDVPVYGR